MKLNGESPSWYRVAELRPRLRSHAVVEPRYYRGELWYVLKDEITARHFRFPPIAWYMISLMDGSKNLQDIWETTRAKFGEAGAPSQEEVIHLLSRLHSTDVLHCDVPPDTQEMFRRHLTAKRTARVSRHMNPLSLRWSLLDPEQWLQRTQSLVKPLFSWQAVVLWLVIVASALVLTAAHWDELLKHMMEAALAPQNWIFLWLLFPLIKGLHELGHAFAVKIWGGEVHSMGVALLVLTPVPFVDASAASAFPRKSRRILVSAAGIMVELLLASLALFLWLLVEPGIVRDLAAVVIFIAGLSTILFNANPLLKFDGYYMLVDAIEIPNLASRSNRYYGYLAQRYLFGLSEARSPASQPGESAWFACYGAAAFFYRLLIAFSIILFMGANYFFVGVLLACWATATMLLLPLYRICRFLVTNPVIARQRSRAITTSLACLVAASAFVFYWPMPFSTRVDGVIWMPDHSQVRAGVSGDVTGILTAPGEYVEIGSDLFSTEDPFLAYQVEILGAHTMELRSRYVAALSSDRVEAEIIAEQLRNKQAELDQARKELGRQIVTAPASGTFIVPQSQDLQGIYVRQGQLLGYVARLEDANVRVVVTQADISLVRDNTKDVKIRFNSQPYAAVTAAIAREIPAADYQLPSKVLGSAGGGRIQVDLADEEGQRAQQKVFQIELEIAGTIPLAYFGERVQVRFDHGSAPLAEQWYRLGRQLFLRSFGV